MLQAGTVVDEQFEIVSLLGSGAQATVYRAIDLHLQRTVALKIMHREGAQDLDSEQRFQREAGLISLLQHPNILRCYKFGHWQGSLYTCVDFFDGISLATALQNGPLPWSRSLKICAAVANGMQHAHVYGVVHRDLTPRNIMVSKETADSEQVKIVDFGLGKWLGSAGSYQKLTQTGDVIGSIYCMSPEQCSGKNTDGRSDVYSLGCVLYNCLTGEPPFLALEAIAMMQKHLVEEPPSPSKLASHGCPVLVDKVVAKALAKSPDDRYQTMAEFAADLEAILEGKKLSAATNAFLPTNRSQPGNGVRASAIAAGILLVAMAAMFFKTQIICSLLSVLPPATACAWARQLVQGSAPPDQTNRTEIALQAARIAESANFCGPDAVILYSLSNRATTINDGSSDTTHGSLLALRTLLELQHTIPSAEFQQLASLTLSEIPAHCRSHEVCRLCFLIVPALDDRLGRLYVQKGLEIIDTASDQSGLSVIAQLYAYSNFLRRPDSAELLVPMADRCLKALASLPKNEPGRARSCYQTAALIEKLEGRHLPLLLECMPSVETTGAHSPPFSKAEKCQISSWTGYVYRARKDHKHARESFIKALALEDPRLPGNHTDRVTDLVLATALVSGPASGKALLEHFHPDPDRCSEVLGTFLPRSRDRAERLMAAEMLIALPVKTARQALITADARITKAQCLAENPQEKGQAIEEYRKALQYLNADRLMLPHYKLQRTASATSDLIQLIMHDKARTAETMSLLDSLENLPPSLKDYCFQRDTVREQMIRNAGRFSECQKFLNRLLTRYPSILDTARTQREIGHLKMMQEKWDEAIAAYGLSAQLLGQISNSSNGAVVGPELDETRRSLATAEKQKQLSNAKPTAK